MKEINKGQKNVEAYCAHGLRINTTGLMGT